MTKEACQEILDKVNFQKNDFDILYQQHRGWNSFHCAFKYGNEETIQSAKKRSKDDPEFDKTPQNKGPGDITPIELLREREDYLEALKIVDSIDSQRSEGVYPALKKDIISDQKDFETKKVEIGAGDLMNSFVSPSKVVIGTAATIIVVIVGMVSYTTYGRQYAKRIGQNLYYVGSSVMVGISYVGNLAMWVWYLPIAGIGFVTNKILPYIGAAVCTLTWVDNKIKKLNSLPGVGSVLTSMSEGIKKATWYSWKANIATGSVVGTGSALVWREVDIEHKVCDGKTGSDAENIFCNIVPTISYIAKCVPNPTEIIGKQLPTALFVWNDFPLEETKKGSSGKGSARAKWRILADFFLWMTESKEGKTHYVYGPGHVISSGIKFVCKGGLRKFADIHKGSVICDPISRMPLLLEYDRQDISQKFPQCKDAFKGAGGLFNYWKVYEKDSWITLGIRSSTVLFTKDAIGLASDSISETTKVLEVYRQAGSILALEHFKGFSEQLFQESLSFLFLSAQTKAATRFIEQDIGRSETFKNFIANFTGWETLKVENSSFIPPPAWFIFEQFMLSNLDSNAAEQKAVISELLPEYSYKKNDQWESSEICGCEHQKSIWEDFQSWAAKNHGKVIEGELICEE